MNHNESDGMSGKNSENFCFQKNDCSEKKQDKRKNIEISKENVDNMKLK